MEFTQYIKPEMLVLVPVLWLIGNALKRTPKVPDWLIPYVLGIMGVAGCARPEYYGVVAVYRFYTGDFGGRNQCLGEPACQTDGETG